MWRRMPALRKGEGEGHDGQADTVEEGHASPLLLSSPRDQSLFSPNQPALLIAVFVSSTRWRMSHSHSLTEGLKDTSLQSESHSAASRPSLRAPLYPPRSHSPITTTFKMAGEENRNLTLSRARRNPFNPFSSPPSLTCLLPKASAIFSGSEQAGPSTSSQFPGTSATGLPGRFVPPHSPAKPHPLPQSIPANGSAELPHKRTRKRLTATGYQATQLRQTGWRRWWHLSR